MLKKWQKKSAYYDTLDVVTVIIFIALLQNV